MAIYRRPGIFVDEVLNPSVAPSGVSGSIASFVGTNSRGPVLPTLVSSWAEYVSKFGGFNTNYVGATNGNLTSALPYAVYTFFANGGRQAYITRVASSDSVAASITLFDGAGNAGPNTVLKIDALDPGVWAGGATSSQVTYGLGFDVIRTGASPYRFDLNIYYFPAGVTPSTSSAANASYLVEKFQDLSMNPADARYAPNIINSSATSNGNLSTGSFYGGSNYIKVTDMGATATPYIAPAPQGQGVTSATIPLTISANGTAQPAVTNNNSIGTLGSDGTVLTVGTGGTASLAYYKAVSGLDLVPGNLILNLPAVSDAYTLAPILDYCGNRGDIFLVMDPAAGSAADTSGVLGNYRSFVDPSNGTVYSNNPASANSNGNKPQVAANIGYCSVYYPWLTIGDPSSSTPGVTRNVPPGGAVIGAIQKNDATRGPWFAPAGINTTLNAVGVEKRLTNAELDGLNNPASVYTSGVYPFVNAIRSMPGAGVCIYGARTFHQGFSDKYVNVRRTLIDVKYNLVQLTQFAVFQPNDENLWTQLQSICSEYLMSVWQQGGLRGATPQNAFFVKCDASINNATTVANGEVHVQVGLAVQYPAEFVIISIGQFDGGTTVSEA